MFTFPYSYSFLTYAPNNKSTLPIHFMYHVSGINQPPTSLINQICPTTISTTFLLVLCSCCFHRFFLRDYCITLLCKTYIYATPNHDSVYFNLFTFYHNNNFHSLFLLLRTKKEALDIFLTNPAAFPKKVKLTFIERFIFLPKVVIRHSI